MQTKIQIKESDRLSGPMFEIKYLDKIYSTKLGDYMFGHYTDDPPDKDYHVFGPDEIKELGLTDNGTDILLSILSSRI